MIVRWALDVTLVNPRSYRLAGDCRGFPILMVLEARRDANQHTFSEILGIVGDLLRVRCRDGRNIHNSIGPIVVRVGPEHFVFVSNGLPRPLIKTGEFVESRFLGRGNGEAQGLDLSAHSYSRVDNTGSGCQRLYERRRLGRGQKRRSLLDLREIDKNGRQPLS